MIITDLRELKALLEIDANDSTEDKKLLFLIEHASKWIEEMLNRDFTYKTRTQYYKGSGTTKLLLRNRPVYPNPPSPYSAITVNYDTSGYFGQTSGSFADATTVNLVYGQDYTLQIDQDDGSSRSGILISIGDLWIKPVARIAGWLSPFVADDTGSYQVIYTAGYTVDTLPAQMRQACNLLVARLRYVWPLGVEIGSEGYEERSMAVVTSEKQRLWALIWPMVMSMRNWKF